MQPNISTEEGVPDYSFLKSGRTVLFMEAKKLSVDVEEKEIIRKLGQYCFGEGMKYGVPSNGSNWILFRAFREDTTMTERIAWKADIENDDMIGSVRKLNMISKDNIENVETFIKKLQILDEVWNLLTEEPEELVEAINLALEESIRRNYPEYEFASSEIKDFVTERVRELISPSAETNVEGIAEPELWDPTSSPEKMKIGKAAFVDIRFLYEILINTANYLIKEGKLRPSDCPITIRAHKRNLVNREPKHTDGSSFRGPKKLSNGLWIETHYSAENAIDRADGLLEKFGYPDGTLVVQ